LYQNYFFIIRSFHSPAIFVIIRSIIIPITAPAQIISQNVAHAHSEVFHINTQVAIKREIKTPIFAHLKNTGILKLQNGLTVIKPAIATTKPNTILLIITVHIIGLFQAHTCIDTISVGIFGFEENHTKHNKPKIKPSNIPKISLFVKLFIII
jgi:hypothetical protein